MHTRKIRNLLTCILVISLGGLASWNISFFRPFSAAYPPNVPYQVQRSGVNQPDSVEAPVGLQYKTGAFGEFWLGQHYRYLWTTPVKAPVLELHREGLVITKRGGGMQTTSFTLKDKSGLSYSLRSLDKDPISVIPVFLWRTVLGNFIRDQVSATDPFALPVVLALTNAAGIFRADARLVFVRKEDPAFKLFKLTGSGFYYLMPKVSRPGITSPPISGYAGVYPTEFLLASLKRHSGNRIDTAFYLRCRLFDLFIGDWDRHAGQWDWAGFKTGTDTVFYALPKDRDQALGHYSDGVLPFLLTRNFAVRKITSLTPGYEDIAGFSENGRNLDAMFLKTLPLAAFKLEARALQHRLSNKALHQALQNYPKPVAERHAALLYKTLQARRQALVPAAQNLAEIIKQLPVTQ